MKVYHEDSAGEKCLVGEGFDSLTEAMNAIMAHSKLRFAYPRGGKVTFEALEDNSRVEIVLYNGKGIGYSIEQEPED